MLGGPLFRVSLVIISAMAFGAGLYRGASKDVGTEFFAAFVLEIAMSAENLFAIYLVFRYFRVPAALQEHVLWWGFGLSALLRGAVIISGGLFIAAQKEAILLFACVVIYSGYRLAIHGAPEDMAGHGSHSLPPSHSYVYPAAAWSDLVRCVIPHHQRATDPTVNRARDICMPRRLSAPLTLSENTSDTWTSL